MATEHHHLSVYRGDELPDISEMTFGVITSEWNWEITGKLQEGCIKTLLKEGVEKDNIISLKVPGSFELPTAASLLAENVGPNAIICLGCIIKGDTKHDEYIANAVAHGIMSVGTEQNVPTIFGVLTTDSEQQAKDRAGGKHGNKGVEAAVSAIKMASLAIEIRGMDDGLDGASLLEGLFGEH